MRWTDSEWAALYVFILRYGHGVPPATMVKIADAVIEQLREPRASRGEA